MRLLMLFTMVIPLMAQVVVNEIYYDSPTSMGKEPYVEWIELYNPGSDPIDVTGWTISDDPDPENPGTEGSFTFPSASIEPHGFLLLMYNADTFNAYFGTPLSIFLVYGEEAPKIKLGNSGEDVHLFDAQLDEVDVVWYGNGGDMDSTFAAEDVPSGSSIGRVPDGVDTDDPSSDFQELNPPTPGSSNALDVNEWPSKRGGDFGVKYWPNPANSVVWFGGDEGHELKVSVFSLDGRVLEEFNGQGVFSWNPDLPEGIYILRVREMINRGMGQEVGGRLVILR